MVTARHLYTCVSHTRSLRIHSSAIHSTPELSLAQCRSREAQARQFVLDALEDLVIVHALGLQLPVPRLHVVIDTGHEAIERLQDGPPRHRRGQPQQPLQARFSLG